MKALLTLLLCLPLVVLSPNRAAAELALQLDLGNGISLELVLVKKGEFQQGSPAAETGRGEDETPRRVTLSKDFYLGKYPVTVAQFHRFVEVTGYRTEAEKGNSGGFGFDGAKLVQRKEFTWRKPGYPLSEDCPVTIVTYNDAAAFNAWLSKKAARKISLPTEAQWEYACRAGTTTRFYSGDKEADLRTIGWYRGNAARGAQPAGKKHPNAWGLYDMSGNVYEWCGDWYGPYVDRATDPLETRGNLTNPPRRVLRGGSWLKDADHCRSAARYRNSPASRNADNGFRVAAEAVDENTAAAAIEPAAELPPVERPEQPQPEPSSPIQQSGPRPQEVVSPPAYADFGLFGVAFLVIFGVIGWQVIKSLLSGGSQTNGPATRGASPLFGSQPMTRVPMHIEPADDGFWIHPTGCAIGSVIHYRYQIFGAPHHSTTVVDTGRRQFVFTGGRPTAINVAHVAPPVDPLSGTFGDSSPPPDGSFGDSATVPDGSFGDTSGPSSTSSSSSFGGFPAAY